MFYLLLIVVCLGSSYTLHAMDQQAIKIGLAAKIGEEISNLISARRPTSKIEDNKSETYQSYSDYSFQIDNSSFKCKITIVAENNKETGNIRINSVAKGRFNPLAKKTVIKETITDQEISVPLFNQLKARHIQQQAKGKKSKFFS